MIFLVKLKLRAQETKCVLNYVIGRVKKWCQLVQGVRISETASRITVCTYSGLLRREAHGFMRQVTATKCLLKS